MEISQKDRGILRELAKKQMELAMSERNRRLYEEWAAYGKSKVPARPMVTVELWTFAEQVLTPLLECEGEWARAIESRMRSPMVNFTLFEDDSLVPDYYAVSLRRSFRPWGLEVRRKETGGVGHHFIPYLHVLEDDDWQLGPSVYGFDEEATEREVAEMQDLFGDILPVVRKESCLGACLTQDIVHIMDMQEMYVSMITEDDRFLAMIERLTDDYLAYFDSLEKSGLLRTAARMQHLGQGSYCFTDEFEDDRPGAALKDLWLYTDSQETSGVSPEMYKELVFPSYKRLMERFGLVSYGCCEPVNAIWDDCLSQVKNLRKVSVSAWCDEEFMGERLRGTGITYLRKPPATILGMDTPVLDEEETLKCFRKTAKAARGCKLEIPQRDVYRVGHSAEKVRRYVELARQGLEDWRP